MKKLVSLLLAAAFMLAMTSCGGNGGSESSSESSLPSLESIESSNDSSLEDSETSSEPESSSSEEESSSQSSSDQESSSSSPVSRPAQNKPSTSSKPASSSNSVESSNSENQSSSNTPQKPPIPKPESSSSSSSVGTSVGASAVYDAMDSAVAARHEGVDAAIMNRPMSIDDSTLSDMFDVSLDDVVSYKGTYAGSMTNCDIMLVVEAKDGKADTVKKALQDKQAAQKKQFEHYGVMGNIERLEASKVVSNGNFVALLIVGVMGDEEEGYDCAGDVSAANSAFTNALKK